MNKDKDSISDEQTFVGFDLGHKDENRTFLRRGMKFIAEVPNDTRLFSYENKVFVTVPSTGETFTVTDHGLEKIHCEPISGIRYR